ncbi:MAG: 30S ribosomal protein S18 [Dehalococcoidia bacterium]|nr:30S ribosomal protein S18 [Chloroflexota bacterium]MXX17889.1 30S ribosomal protein S18 [Dehalococcoidia bacterium]MYD29170.1 30S ribosomal protein S18 [Dehalococcoidia bacterium]
MTEPRPFTPPAAAPGAGAPPAGDRPADTRPPGDRPPGDRPGGDRRGPGDRPRRGGGGRRFGGRRRLCRLCNKVRCSPGDEYKVDYKDVDRLRHFINDRGKIEPRRKLATCALAQRAISHAVKRARHVGLLPYTLQHVRETRIFPLRG